MLHYLWNLEWDKIEGISITLTLLVVLRTYLRSKKIEKMDFYFRIKNDLYSDGSKLLSGSIWEGTILMEEENGRPYLKYTVTENNVQINNKLSLDLLDNLEDLYLFYDDGLISKRLLYEGFGTVIIKTGDNIVVNEFLNRLRVVDGDEDYYTGLGKLVKVVKEYQKNKKKLIYKNFSKL